MNKTFAVINGSAADHYALYFCEPGTGTGTANSRSRTNLTARPARCPIRQSGRRKPAAEAGAIRNSNITRTRPTTLTLTAGSLVINAIKLTPPLGLSCWYGPCQYTSARLITKGKFDLKYGRFEARIKVPRGQGVWPAFWMLGNNIDTAGWPQSGEIDIMENIGREPSIVHGTVHGPGYSGANGIGTPFSLSGNTPFADGFHTYAIEWSASEMRWYVDNIQYQVLTPKNLPQGSTWVFDHPFFMILNFAVGGSWPGNPDANTTFPQAMQVDFVRVYRR